MPHYGILVAFNALGFWLEDSNFGGCGYRVHFILWTNPHLKGFWDTP